VEKLASWSLFALPVALVGLFSTHTLTSVYQDIGRHLTLGKIIWDTKTIPKTNLFSYTNPDFPFINHHWLSELGLYAGSVLVGLKGLIVIKALMLATAFALALASAWKARSSAAAAIVAIVAFLLMMQRTDVRPEVLSYLFMAWFLFVLYRREGLMWTLPIVQILWVNSHIVFFMGPFIVGCWLIGKVVERGTWRGAISTRTWIVAGLVGVATLCNPNGLAGALYPFNVLDNYAIPVFENQSPALLRANGYAQALTNLLYIGLALAALGFAVNRKQIRANVFGLLTCTGTAYLALTMVRFFPLFSLAMLPAAIRNFDQAGFRLAQIRGWVMAGFGGLILLVFTGKLYTMAHLAQTFGLSVPPGPELAVNYFRSGGFKGPILNNFNIGSYLIWKLPEERVFIDGRPEAYPADFITNVYTAMQADAGTWARESERYGLNAIIWNTRDASDESRTFLARIMEDSSWAPMFQGDRVLILLKRTPENARIIAEHPPVNLDRR
jgi:hypothetical protein